MPMPLPDTIRRHGYPWALIVAFVVLSAWANSLHAPHIGQLQFVAALPPVASALAWHLMVLPAVEASTWRRRSARSAALVVFGFTAWASFEALRVLGERAGLTPPEALPVSIDGLVVVAALAVWSHSRTTPPPATGPATVVGTRVLGPPLNPGAHPNAGPGAALPGPAPTAGRAVQSPPDSRPSGPAAASGPVQPPPGPDAPPTVADPARPVPAASTGLTTGLSSPPSGPSSRPPAVQSVESTGPEVQSSTGMSTPPSRPVSSRPVVHPVESTRPPSTGKSTVHPSTPVQSTGLDGQTPLSIDPDLPDWRKVDWAAIAQARGVKRARAYNIIKAEGQAAVHAARQELAAASAPVNGRTPGNT